MYIYAAQEIALKKGENRGGQTLLKRVVYITLYLYNSYVPILYKTYIRQE